MTLGTECLGSREAELIEWSLYNPYFSNFLLLVQHNSLDDLKKKNTILLQKMTFLALCLKPPARFYSSLLQGLIFLCSTYQHVPQLGNCEVGLLSFAWKT